MPSRRVCSSVLWCSVSLLAADKPAPRVAPAYSAASIVNSADNQAGELAPNMIVTVYGTNLAYGIAGITGSSSGILPTVLGSSETQVYVDDYPADLYYVSPTQVNFLVPPDLITDRVDVRVTVDSLTGPTLSLPLAPAAPGLFQLDATNAVASLEDGSVVTPESPARPGDIVTLWATGLGATNPAPIYGQAPTAPARLVAGANFLVLLDEVPVVSGAVTYAGLAPGFAGLYQINFILPASTGSNPEIRVQMGNAISIANIHLPVILN